MTDDELWQYFLDRQIARTHPFDKDFVWIPKEDFSPMEKHFVKEFNVFYPGTSMRSMGLWRHVHAVEQEDCIFVHICHGNIARFWPLGIPHFFIDVLPYLIFVWCKGVSLHSLFTRPK
ncbi:MAG: hypothetical protein AAB573_02965 [Patescibacteria group bacterium]